MSVIDAIQRKLQALGGTPTGDALLSMPTTKLKRKKDYIEAPDVQAFVRALLTQLGQSQPLQGISQADKAFGEAMGPLGTPTRISRGIGKAVAPAATGLMTYMPEMAWRAGQQGALRATDPNMAWQEKAGRMAVETGLPMGALVAGGALSNALPAASATAPFVKRLATNALNLAPVGALFGGASEGAAASTEGLPWQDVARQGLKGAGIGALSSAALGAAMTPFGVNVGRKRPMTEAEFEARQMTEQPYMSAREKALGNEYERRLNSMANVRQMSTDERANVPFVSQEGSFNPNAKVSWKYDTGNVLAQADDAYGADWVPTENLNAKDTKLVDTFNNFRDWLNSDYRGNANLQGKSIPSSVIQDYAKANKMRPDEVFNAISRAQDVINGEIGTKGGYFRPFGDIGGGNAKVQKQVNSTFEKVLSGQQDLGDALTDFEYGKTGDLSSTSYINKLKEGVKGNKKATAVLNELDDLIQRPRVRSYLTLEPTEKWAGTDVYKDTERIANMPTIDSKIEKLTAAFRKAMGGPEVTDEGLYDPALIKTAKQALSKKKIGRAGFIEPFGDIGPSSQAIQEGSDMTGLGITGPSSKARNLMRTPVSEPVFSITGGPELGDKGFLPTLNEPFSREKTTTGNFDKLVAEQFKKEAGKRRLNKPEFFNDLADSLQVLQTYSDIANEKIPPGQPRANAIDKAVTRFKDMIIKNHDVTARNQFIYLPNKKAPWLKGTERNVMSYLDEILNEQDPMNKVIKFDALANAQHQRGNIITMDLDLHGTGPLRTRINGAVNNWLNKLRDYSPNVTQAVERKLVPDTTTPAAGLFNQAPSRMGTKRGFMQVDPEVQRAILDTLGMAALPVAAASVYSGAKRVGEAFNRRFK